MEFLLVQIFVTRFLLKNKSTVEQLSNSSMFRSWIVFPLFTVQNPNEANPWLSDSSYSSSSSWTNCLASFSFLSLWFFLLDDYGDGRLHFLSQSWSFCLSRSFGLGCCFKTNPQLNSCLIAACFAVEVCIPCSQCRTQTNRIRDCRTLHILHRLLGRIVRLLFSSSHYDYFFLTIMTMKICSCHHHLGLCCYSLREILFLCELSGHTCSILCPSSNLQFGWRCWFVLWFAVQIRLHLIMERLSAVASSCIHLSSCMRLLDR